MGIATTLIFSSGSVAANVADDKKYLNPEHSLLTEEANIRTVSDQTGIIDELGEQRLKSILADVIKIRGGKIGKIIEKLESRSPNWSWVVREGSLPKYVNGKTKLIPKGVMSILDYDHLENATDLSIARTIIHEMVHAYLSLYFRYEQIDAIKEYPEIYRAWQIKKYADFNQLQHDEIEKTFLIDIAFALKEYGDKTNADADDVTYFDLAWGGLNVENNHKLTAKAKRRIQNRLSEEQSRQLRTDNAN